MRNLPASLDRRRSNPGRRRTIFLNRERQIAGNVYLFVSRNSKIGVDLDAPGAVERHAQRSCERRGDHTRAPQHRARGDALLPDRHTRAIDAGDPRVGPHFDPELVQLTQGRCRQIGRIGGQNARGAFQQQDARPVRVDASEFRSQGMARDLDQRAGELHARRPGSHDDERQQRFTSLRIRFPVRFLKCLENTPSNLERVFDGLEPGGETPHSGLPK